jgi:hypothetical protein
MDYIKRKCEKNEMMYYLFVSAWRGVAGISWTKYEVYRCQIIIWLNKNQSKERKQSLETCR